MLGQVYLVLVTLYTPHFTISDGARELEWVTLHKIGYLVFDTLNTNANTKYQ